MKLSFKLNGIDVVYEVQPNDFLADVLRRNGILSVKIGCNESSCGACTILFDSKPILACSLLALKAEGHNITTIEGIQEEAAKIADCFSSEGADQCGFCNVGYALVLYALKKELKNPTDEQIKSYVVGNLCRCSGYQSQLKAIHRYLEVK